MNKSASKSTLPVKSAEKIRWVSYFLKSMINLARIYGEEIRGKGNSESARVKRTTFTFSAIKKMEVKSCTYENDVQ